MSFAKSKIGAVAVVGGTHGNELTGTAVVRHLQSQKVAQEYPGFQIEYLIGNEEAIAQNKRYIDKDLNRCFQLADLNDKSKRLKEEKLAKQINQMLGPKGDPRVDFIIDLHTSTANMRTNIVLTKIDPFHLRLAAYLKSKIPDAVITSETEIMPDHHFLCSIADKSIVVEIGPVAQGCLDYSTFAKTKTAVFSALDFIDQYNQQQLSSHPDEFLFPNEFSFPEELELMNYTGKIYFPVDEEGVINAFIHPKLIGKDFSRIDPGMPLFKTFAGEDVLYEGESAHIAFVNEAAYYDQKIAMSLCLPKRYCLKSFQQIGH